MQPGDEDRQAYAREQLTSYLVARGIKRDLAKATVEKHVTQFTAVDNGRQLMVVFEGRPWPTFNRGQENHWNNRLADALLYEALHPPANEAEDPPVDSDSPYLDSPGKEVTEPQQTGKQIGEFI